MYVCICIHMRMLLLGKGRKASDTIPTLPDIDIFGNFHRQVTNGYEAYQMIAFGELAYWPAWAAVLSRWRSSSSTTSPTS